MGAIEDFIAQLQGGSTYDPLMEAAKRQALMKSSDLQAQYDLGKSNLGTEFDITQYNINKALDQATRGNEDRFADTGTIHSSIYAKEQGDTANRFQDMLTQAAQRRAMAEAQMGMGLRSGQTDLMSMLTGEEANSAARQAAAEYQRQQDAAAAQFQQQQLQYMREANQYQQQQYQQQTQFAQQQAQQQQSYYQQLMAQMQPTVYPTGQATYSGAPPSNASTTLGMAADAANRINPFHDNTPSRGSYNEARQNTQNGIPIGVPSQGFG